jgi:methionine synthase II (cobalamin-independent)
MWKYQEQKTYACTFVHVSHTKLGWMRNFPYFRRLKYTNVWLFRDITFPYTYFRKDNKFSFAPLISTFIKAPSKKKKLPSPLHYVKWSFHKRSLYLQSAEILYYRNLVSLLALLPVFSEPLFCLSYMKVEVN